MSENHTLCRLQVLAVVVAVALPLVALPLCPAHCHLCSAYPALCVPITYVERA
jgi:hypothetical protein